MNAARLPADIVLLVAPAAAVAGGGVCDTGAFAAEQTEACEPNEADDETLEYRKQEKKQLNNKNKKNKVV